MFVSVSRFSEITLGSSLKVKIEFCNKNALVGNNQGQTRCALSNLAYWNVSAYGTRFGTK